MTRPVTRRQFVQLIGLGGLTATTLPILEAPARAAADTGDLEILTLAVTAELLAVEAYTRAVEARQFTGIVQIYLVQALRQENEHLAALSKAMRSMGGSPPKPSFVFESSTFENPILMLRLLNALEDAFVGAYLGALPVLRDKSLVAAAGAILGVEAGHRVLVREARLNFRDPAVSGVRAPNDRDFESGLTAEQASTALRGFIKR